MIVLKPYISLLNLSWIIKCLFQRNMVPLTVRFCASKTCLGFPVAIFVDFLLTASRRLLCWNSYLIVRRWFHMWRLSLFVIVGEKQWRQCQPSQPIVRLESSRVYFDHVIKLTNHLLSENNAVARASTANCPIGIKSRGLRSRDQINPQRSVDWKQWRQRQPLKRLVRFFFVCLFFSCLFVVFLFLFFFFFFLFVFFVFVFFVLFFFSFVVFCLFVFCSTVANVSVFNQATRAQIRMRPSLPRYAVRSFVSSCDSFSFHLVEN